MGIGHWELGVKLKIGIVFSWFIYHKFQLRFPGLPASPMTNDQCPILS
ncbi:MAG: hypothetical protein F6J93_36580 [Oscillatoria sp. SIO1A7]|nr:hypothetical protein [Oscillatoria sp. SIO1A7]